MRSFEVIDTSIGRFEIADGHQVEVELLFYNLSGVMEPGGREEIGP